MAYNEHLHNSTTSDVRTNPPTVPDVNPITVCFQSKALVAFLPYGYLTT